MSSWVTIKALRDTIKTELEKVFRKHEKYTENTLNGKINVGTSGEFLDQTAIIKFAFDNSFKELRERITEFLDLITEKGLGPILKTKYRLEIQQMKYEYFMLLKGLPKPDDDSLCVLTPSYDEKDLALKGMKQALGKTMNRGFRIMLENSHKKLTELINYQIQACFRYAIKDYIDFMEQYILSKAGDITPEAMLSIDSYTRSLFLELQSISTRQINVYIKSCIQYGYEENMKPLPLKKFVTLFRIETLLKKKNFEEIFPIVLTMNDRVCLDYVCESITPDDIFIDDKCVLPYDTLLLFVQTLGDSLCEKTHYKIKFLKKAVPFIDTIGMISKERVRFIVKKMLIHLEHLMERRPLYLSNIDVRELYANVSTLFTNCC